jgi:hypothetical protein
MCEKSKLPHQAAGYFSAEANRYFTSPFKLECRNFMDTFRGIYNNRFEGSGEFSYSTRELKLDNCWQNEEVKTLLSALKDNWDVEIVHKRPEARDWWKKADKAEIWYVTTHACYLVFGVKEDAHTGYPVPHHPGVRSMISAYVSVQEELDRAEAKKRAEILINAAHEKIERKCAKELAKLSDITPPAMLQLRVLSSKERQEVLERSMEVLKRSERALNALPRVCQFLPAPQHARKLRHGLNRCVPRKAGITPANQGYGG